VRSFTPFPSDPEVAAAAQRVRRDLARLDALVSAGQLEDVSGALESLLADAEATNDRPIVSEVLTLRGRFATFDGDPEMADRSLERAQLLAEAEGYDGAIFDTHVWMAVLESTRRNDFGRAHRHVRSAAAVLERMGSPPSSEAALLLVTARVHVVQREHEEAAKVFAEYLALMTEQGRQNESIFFATAGAYGNVLSRLGREAEADAVITDALERARPILGRTHPELGSLLIYKARELGEQARYEEALATFDEAQAIIAGAFGPMHTNLGAMLNDKGVVLTYLGRYQEALDTFSEAAPIVIGAFGQENVQYATLLVNAGEALIELDRAQEAVVAFERAAELRGRLYGRDDMNYGYALADLGIARLELGQLAPARVALEEALQPLTAALGKDHVDRGNALVALGELELIEGRPAAAERHFAEVIELCDRSGNEGSGLVGRARFGLARVRAVSGDMDGAFALAREARAELAKYAWTGRQVAKVDRWLAEHRRR
jgi:tetratricopeptide (TPR) repeat protein